MSDDLFYTFSADFLQYRYTALPPVHASKPHCLEYNHIFHLLLVNTLFDHTSPGTIVPSAHKVPVNLTVTICYTGHGVVVLEISNEEEWPRVVKGTNGFAGVGVYAVGAVHFGGTVSPQSMAPRSRGRGRGRGRGIAGQPSSIFHSDGTAEVIFRVQRMCLFSTTIDTSLTLPLKRNHPYPHPRGLAPGPIHGMQMPSHIDHRNRHIWGWLLS